jgi:hypothetical protein
MKCLTVNAKWLNVCRDKNCRIHFSICRTFLLDQYWLQLTPGGLAQEGRKNPLPFSLALKVVKTKQVAVCNDTLLAPSRLL